MQPCPDLILTVKHGPLKPKCINELDPPTQKGGGHSQTGILPLDTSGPIVKTGGLLSIQDIIAKNFSVQSSLGHVGQSLHEAYNLEPPSTLPWDLCKLSKDNGRGHTLSEPANLAEERQLQVCHLLQLWQQVASAKVPQTSQPYDTVGLTTASKRRLIIGKDLSQCSSLCLAASRDRAPCPF